MKGRGPKAALLGLSAAVGGLAGGLVVALFSGILAGQPASTATPAITPRGPLALDETHIADLFESAGPSVVFITTLDQQPALDALEIGTNRQGAGSGFVWDASGHIVTNLHVVSEAAGVVVTLDDQTSWVARVVGSSPRHDLAVLAIDAPANALRPLAMGTSSDLRVGQLVLAIGNPFGLDHTLTTGIVSALDRAISTGSGQQLSGMIQTDASINPGNSGGPVLDSAGRLIGVSTAIVRQGALSGIGFAVPVDTVRQVVPQLIDHGHLSRPWLGLRVAQDSTARRLGVPGLLVLGVAPGSPAALAGIRGTEHDGRQLVLGDVLTALDHSPLRSSEDLARALETRAVGQVVHLELSRDGRTEGFALTLSPPASQNF